MVLDLREPDHDELGTNEGQSSGGPSSRRSRPCRGRWMGVPHSFDSHSFDYLPKVKRTPLLSSMLALG